MARAHVHEIAGSMSRCVWSIPMLFAWFLAYALLAGPPGNLKGTSGLALILGMFLKPLVMAGVLAGIAKAAAGMKAPLGAFFND